MGQTLVEKTERASKRLVQCEHGHRGAQAQSAVGRGRRAGDEEPGTVG